MSEYRGADGWVWDENGTRRMPDHKTKISKPEKAADPTPPKEKPTECPNCGLGALFWRREESLCTSCGWGKKEAPVAAPRSDREVGSCCIAIGVLLGSPMLGAGIGSLLAGFGGMLAGVGLSLLLGAVLIAALAVHERKES